MYLLSEKFNTKLFRDLILTMKILNKPDDNQYVSSSYNKPLWFNCGLPEHIDISYLTKIREKYNFISLGNFIETITQKKDSSPENFRAAALAIMYEIIAKEFNIKWFTQKQYDFLKNSIAESAKNDAMLFLIEFKTPELKTSQSNISNSTDSTEFLKKFAAMDIDLPTLVTGLSLIPVEENNSEILEYTEKALQNIPMQIDLDQKHFYYAFWTNLCSIQLKRGRNYPAIRAFRSLNTKRMQESMHLPDYSVSKIQYFISSNETKTIRTERAALQYCKDVIYSKDAPEQEYTDVESLFKQLNRNHFPIAINKAESLAEAFAADFDSLKIRNAASICTLSELQNSSYLFPDLNICIPLDEEYLFIWNVLAEKDKKLFRTLCLKSFEYDIEGNESEHMKLGKQLLGDDFLITYGKEISTTCFSILLKSENLNALHFWDNCPKQDSVIKEKFLTACSTMDTEDEITLLEKLYRNEDTKADVVKAIDIGDLSEVSFHTPNSNLLKLKKLLLYSDVIFFISANNKYRTDWLSNILYFLNNDNSLFINCTQEGSNILHKILLFLCKQENFIENERNLDMMQEIVQKHFKDTDKTIFAEFENILNSVRDSITQKKEKEQKEKMQREKEKFLQTFSERIPCDLQNADKYFRHWEEISYEYYFNKRISHSGINVSDTEKETILKSFIEPIPMNILENYSYQDSFLNIIKYLLQSDIANPLSIAKQLYLHMSKNSKE